MAEQSRLLEALRASNERKEYEIRMAKPCAAARAVHGRGPPDGRPPSSLCSNSLCSNKLGEGAQPADPPLAGYGHLECFSSDSSSPMPSVSRWSRGTAKLGGSPPGGSGGDQLGHREIVAEELRDLIRRNQLPAGARREEATRASDTREEQRRGRDSRRHESEEGLNRTKFATSLLPGSARLAMIRWFS